MKLPQVVSKQEWDHSTVIHAIQVIEKRRWRTCKGKSREPGE
jgi:chromosomal replication initiation ATPase DnaA